MLLSSLLVLALVPAQAFAAVVTRGPYLQRSASDSMVVRWRTDVATDSRLYYGPAPGALTSFIDGADVTKDHELTVTGLDPTSTYTYAIASSSEVLAGDDDAHHFRTHPAPGAPVDLRLWVLGDSGTADASATAVRDAYRGFSASRPADLMMLLGDNAYNTGSDAEYQAALFNMYLPELAYTPVWPTIGNHDAISADSLTESGVYYDIFSLPRWGESGGVASGTRAYYSFDYGDVHFVCLDSHDLDRSPGGAMLAWLEQDLAATQARWLVAFWHHPPYSDGSHNSDTELPLGEMRRNAVPILEEYGVDLLLSGHSHSYERSPLIDGYYGSSGQLEPWMILNPGDGDPAGDGAYEKATVRAGHDGSVYVVAGSSGQITAAPLNHPVMLVSLEQLGSLVVDVTDDTMDVSFVETSGIAADHFRIAKTRGDLCGDGILGGTEDCDDGNTAGGDCCPADCTFDLGCAAAAPVALRVRHDANPAGDRLDWKWQNGQAIDFAELGDPSLSTAYALCVYDYSADALLSLTRLSIPASTAWRSIGQRRFVYRDRSGAAAGVRRVAVTTGLDGATKAHLRAAGNLVGLPAAAAADRYFEQDSHVVVQLINDGGRCWTSNFLAADGANNTAAQFIDTQH